jgi:hypothetical protein
MGVYLGSTQVDMQGGFVTGGASGASLQSKTVSHSESAQTVKADNGYDGLSQVTVNAVSKTYVGSGVTKKVLQLIRRERVTRALHPASI